MPVAPPHGSKLVTSCLDRLIDADGREREECAAQAQDAEAEQQRERADRDAGD